MEININNISSNDFWYEFKHYIDRDSLYHGSLLGQGDNLWGGDSDRPGVDRDGGLLSGCHCSHWKHIKIIVNIHSIQTHTFFLKSSKPYKCQFYSVKVFNKKPDKIILFSLHIVIYLPLYWCPMAMFIFVVFHHKFFRNIVNFCLNSVYNRIYII